MSTPLTCNGLQVAASARATLCHFEPKLSSTYCAPPAHVAHALGWMGHQESLMRRPTPDFPLPCRYGCYSAAWCTHLNGGQLAEKLLGARSGDFGLHHGALGFARQHVQGPASWKTTQRSRCALCCVATSTLRRHRGGKEGGGLQLLNVRDGQARSAAGST